MNDMWTALERYQPFAEQHGFGAAWLKMTTDRTAPATRLAWLTTTGASGASDATGWATAASSMAVSAVVAAAAWEADPEATAAAIEYINRAIALEETK